MLKKIPMPAGHSLGFTTTDFGSIDSWDYYGQEGEFSSYLYAIRKAKGVYDIIDKDGECVDTIEVINGVVHFSEGMVVNHLHTFGRYGVDRHGYIKWHLLAAESDTLLTSAVRKQPGDYVATITKLLDVDLDPIKSVSNSSEVVKVVESTCPAAKYLKGVLQSCATATIAWEAVPSIKGLFKLTHVPTGCAESNGFVRLVECLRRLSGRVTPTGMWYYTSTQEEFNALVLMQSYSRKVNSCQYFPVHLLGDSAKLAVTSNAQFRALTKGLAEKGFLTNQCVGFGEGVRYFFQLSEEGLVSKRFYVWQKDSSIVGNNYYNVSARPCTVTYVRYGASVSIKPATEREPDLPVYSNRITEEVSLPDVFTEENLKAYLVATSWGLGV